MKLDEAYLDELRLRVMLYGWSDLTDREAMVVQWFDNGFGCTACRA